MTYATTQSVLATSVFFPILGALVVTLRFWYRIHQRSGDGLGLDDWLCLAALVSKSLDTFIDT